MTRRKIRLAYIINDSERKASYKKRKKGLLKKLEELSILCEIEACTIMYSPFDKEPVLWPSVEGVQHTVARFRNMPEMEQTRRMINQESFIRDRGVKLGNQLLKLLRDNKEKQMTELMYRILSGEQLPLMSDYDLNDLGWVIDQHLAQINAKRDALKRDASSSTPALGPIPTLAPNLILGPTPAFGPNLVLGSTQTLGPNLVLGSTQTLGPHGPIPTVGITTTFVPTPFFPSQTYPQDLTRNWTVPNMFGTQNYQGTMAYPQGLTSQSDATRNLTVPGMFGAQNYQGNITYSQYLTSQIGEAGNFIIPNMFGIPNYQGNIYMPNPMFPMSNFQPRMGWYENWMRYNINQNDPNQVGLSGSGTQYDPTQEGPSSSKIHYDPTQEGPSGSKIHYDPTQEGPSGSKTP